MAPKPKGSVKPDPKNGKFIEESMFAGIPAVILGSLTAIVVAFFAPGIALFAAIAVGIASYLYFKKSYSLPTTKKFVYVSGKFRTESLSLIHI